jgi:type I restriction enzyme S subunit
MVRDNKMQHTDIGLIPVDWQVVELGEIGKNIIGLTYSPNDVKEYGQLVLRSSNIQNNKLAFFNNVFVRMDLPDRVIVKENDILICVRNGSKDLIGKCALIDKKTEGSAFGAFMSIYRTQYSKFIFHQFQSNIIQKQIDEVMGATINQLTNKDLSRFQIPLPPLSEQEAIARALSDCDLWVESLEQVVAKKRLIKQGAIQELLTPKEDWEVKKLGDIADVRDGTHQTPTYVETGIPFYSVESVTKNDFKNTKFITEGAHKILTKTFRIERGDILMTRIGSIGDCKLVDWEVNASFYVSLALLKIKKEVSSSYICHFSKSNFFLKEADLNSLQSAIPKKINLGPISNIKILLPPLSEQTRIAKILSDMDEEIEALEQKLKKAGQIKQGMMQELLTGRVRLV